MEVEWVDELPAAIRGRPKPAKWKAFLEALTERPGRWAKMRTAATVGAAANAASKLRDGTIQTPAGRYEYAARGNAVYARYLGEEE